MSYWDQTSVQMELALSRLKTVRHLRVWGISATIGNWIKPDGVGWDNTIRKFRTHQSKSQKAHQRKSIIPKEMEPSHGVAFGFALLDMIIPIIKKAKPHYYLPILVANVKFGFRKYWNNIPSSQER